MLFLKDELMGYPILYLYEYNEFFKTLLYRYKGQYDYSLKDVFLSCYLGKLKRMYKDYVIAVTPSSMLQNNKRGFKPMEEIAKTLDLPLFTGLYKTTDYKQSDQPYSKRKNIHQVIAIKDVEKLNHQKVLIIDDVMTSGQTLMACANCVKQANVKSISFLVLSKRV